MIQVSQAAAREVDFRTANVIVNDWWVVAQGRSILLQDVLSTEIVTRHFKVDWRKHILQQLGVALAVIATVTILYLVGSHSSPMLLVILFGIIRHVFDLRKRSVEFTLILNTQPGSLEIATLNDQTYIETIAKEIGKHFTSRPNQGMAHDTPKLIRHTIWLESPPPEPKSKLANKWAGISITDDAITLPRRSYPIDDVWGAFVQDESTPLVRPYQPRFVVMLIVMLIALGLTFLFVSDMFARGALFVILFGIAILLLAITAKDAVDAWTQASKFVLTLETTEGSTRTAISSNKLYLTFIANSINRKVKDRIISGTSTKAL